MVTYVYPNFNSKVVFLRCLTCWVFQSAPEIMLVGRWYQPPHTHPSCFSAPQWYSIVCPCWGPQGPLLTNIGSRVICDPQACPPQYITQVVLHDGWDWERQGWVLQKFLQGTNTTPEECQINWPHLKHGGQYCWWGVLFQVRVTEGPIAVHNSVQHHQVFFGFLNLIQIGSKDVMLSNQRTFYRIFKVLLASIIFEMTIIWIVWQVN